ncbi:MAG: polysaccharide deacetylase family protein [Pseudomonadota bacterium]
MITSAPKSKFLPGLKKTKLLLVFAWSFCFLAATIHPNQVEAKTCSGSKNKLGVSRTVEIDTTSGPLFGRAQYKRFDFLKPKEVVLTFDDGPIPRTTGKILKALQAHCTKATFFPLGKLAVTYPKMMREKIALGHSVGVHGWSHKNLPRQSLAFAIDDIEKGASAVKLTTGNNVSPFFRFPYLSDSRRVIGYLAKRNFAVFSIDVDSKDYLARSSSRLVNAVMSKLRAKGKGILLFHDTKTVTANAIPELLRRLKAGGFKIVHVVGKNRSKTIAKYDQRMSKYKHRTKVRVADASAASLTKVIRTLSEMEVAIKALKRNPEAFSLSDANKLVNAADGFDASERPATALNTLDRLLTGRQEHLNRMNKELSRARIKVQIKLAKLATDTHELEAALQHYDEAQQLLQGEEDAELTREIKKGLRSAYAKGVETEPDVLAADGWLQRMKQDGFEPTADEYDAVVAKSKGYAEAFGLVQRMKAAGHVPGPRASNALVVLAPDFEMARHWGQKAQMRGHALKREAYEAILSHAQSFDQARPWLDAMRPLGQEPMERVIVGLLSRAGGYLAAHKLLADAQRSGMKLSLAVHADLDPQFMDLEDWDALYAFRPKINSKTPKSTRKIAVAKSKKREVRKVASVKKRATGVKRKATKRKSAKRKITAKKKPKRLKKQRIAKRKATKRKVATKKRLKRIKKQRIAKRKVAAKNRLKRINKQRIAKRKATKRKVAAKKRLKRIKKQRIAKRKVAAKKRLKRIQKHRTAKRKTIKRKSAKRKITKKTNIKSANKHRVTKRAQKRRAFSKRKKKALGLLQKRTKPRRSRKVRRKKG